MEKIKKTGIYAVFLISLLQMHGLAHSQEPAFLSEDYFNKLLLEYNQTKGLDVANLFSMVPGEFRGLIARLEKMAEEDVNLLNPVARALLNSGDAAMMRRAENLFLKDMRAFPSESRSVAELGRMFLYGNGVQKNEKKACEYFEKVYSLNPDNLSIDEYAICLLPYSGRGYKTSYSLACDVLSKAAKNYDRVTEDNNVFKDYYAFDAGRVYGIYGECFFTDDASRKNPSIGIEWLKKAFAMKHPYFSYLYGEKLENGEGVIRDAKAAMIVYEKAAEYGSPNAQNTLGTIYAEGKLVKRDMFMAYKWFLISSAEGYDRAIENRKKAEASLGPAEMRRAETMAKDWRKKYLNKP